MTMTPASALAFFASVIKSGEPWTPICQQAMDEAMAHMLRQANLTGGIPMTLPQNVKDAVKFANAECGKSSDFTFDMSGADWQTIRAHLMSQDAELKILRVKCSGTLANNLCPDHRDKQVGNPCLACTIEKLQSRLAAANKLLRECRRMAARLLPTPHDLYEQIDAHLSENTHG